HEAPLEPRGEPRAAAPAQRRFLQLRDDLIGRNLFRDDLAQRLVPAARLIVGQPPVAAVESRHQDGVRAVIDEFGWRVHALTGCGNPGRPSPRSAACDNSSTSSSSLALFMKLHMRRSFTMSTGASPHAPMHSPSFSVN